MVLPLNLDNITVTPKDASTVMILRDGSAGLEVLLLRRHENSPVLGGAYVFPGGKTNAQDKRFPNELLDRSDNELQTSLAEPSMAPGMAKALWVGAIRETFEESGLLLGVDTSLPSTDIQEQLPFEGVIRQHPWPLRTAMLVPWTRWITPKRPSVTNSRFDTRIFMAACPNDQFVQVDGYEITAAKWVRPLDGLRQYSCGQLDLAPVQMICLVHLLKFSCVEHALDTTRKTAPRLIEPSTFEIDGERVICYPGDPLHSDPTPAWTGPTRLIHRMSHFEPQAGFAFLPD